MLLLLAFFQRSTPWEQIPTGTTVNKVCKTTCVGRRTILLMKSLTAISGGFKETKTVSGAHHYTHAALRIIARAVYKACKPYHHKSIYFPTPKNNPKHSIKHDSILFIPQLLWAESFIRCWVQYTGRQYPSYNNWQTIFHAPSRKLPSHPTPHRQKRRKRIETKQTYTQIKGGKQGVWWGWGFGGVVGERKRRRKKGEDCTA